MSTSRYALGLFLAIGISCTNMQAFSSRVLGSIIAGLQASAVADNTTTKWDTCAVAFPGVIVCVTNSLPPSKAKTVLQGIVFGGVAARAIYLHKDIYRKKITAQRFAKLAGSFVGGGVITYRLAGTNPLFKVPTQEGSDPTYPAGGDATVDSSDNEDLGLLRRPPYSVDPEAPSGSDAIVGRRRAASYSGSSVSGDLEIGRQTRSSSLNSNVPHFVVPAVVHANQKPAFVAAAAAIAVIAARAAATGQTFNRAIYAVDPATQAFYERLDMFRHDYYSPVHLGLLSGNQSFTDPEILTDNIFADIDAAAPLTFAIRAAVDTDIRMAGEYASVVPVSPKDGDEDGEFEFI